MRSFSHYDSSIYASADGKFFAVGRRICNDKFVYVSTIDDWQNHRGSGIFPAVSGRYFLHVAGVESAHRFGNVPVRNDNAKLHMFGVNPPIVDITNLTVPSGYNPPDSVDRGQKLIFIPDAKVIVSASKNLDSLILKRFDIEQALVDSGTNYLVVTSTAPSIARIGEPYEYQINTLSKSGEVIYKLDSAPQGMRISKQGKVTWRPSDNLENSVEKVIVTVRDLSGQEMFHTFSVDIPEVRKLAVAKRREALEKERQLAMSRRLAEVSKRLAALEKEGAERRKAILSRAEKSDDKSRSTAGKSGESKSSYGIEKWTDSTGKNHLRARFVKVENQSQVVLELQDGSKKSVPLGRLSPMHIYRAVKYDLDKRREVPSPGSSNSRSQSRDVVGNTGGRGSVDDRTLVEIARAVERMIVVVKNEKDAVKLIRAVLAPNAVRRLMSDDKDFERFKMGFERQGVVIIRCSKIAHF